MTELALAESLLVAPSSLSDEQREQLELERDVAAYYALLDAQEAAR